MQRPDTIHLHARRAPEADRVPLVTPGICVYQTLFSRLRRQNQSPSLLTTALEQPAPEARAGRSRTVSSFFCDIKLLPSPWQMPRVCLHTGYVYAQQGIIRLLPHPPQGELEDSGERFCLSSAFFSHIKTMSGNAFLPMSSAGLFGLLLINVSKDSFIKLMNFSFLWKHTSITWSTRSLKSSRSCTISLSFSGLMTIVVPKVYENTHRISGRYHTCSPATDHETLI